MFDLVASTDITAPELLAHEEKRGREETVVVDVPTTRFEDTLFLVYLFDVPSIRRNGTVTPTAAELKQQAEPVRAPDQTALVYDAAARARDARIALLARKYEGVSTIEDDARLAILTARLRKLSPRVTSIDLDKLTTMVGEIEQVSSNLDQIQGKLGLK